jgi:cytochrome c
MKWHYLGGVLALFAVANAPSRAADPNLGENLFTRRCSGCHAVDTDKEGPRLRGVFGRKAGTLANFQYSIELRKSGIVWDEAALKRWLEDPQKLIPGNDMEFHVGDAGERDQIVAYLKSLPAR